MSTLNITNIDKTAPTIALAQDTGVVTSPKTVTATISDDESGVSVQKWAYGSQTADYFASNGTTFTGSTFSCENNIVCTVYAKDNAGNEAIKTITISGITDWTFNIAVGYPGYINQTPYPWPTITSTILNPQYGVAVPKDTFIMGTIPAGTWNIIVTGTGLTKLSLGFIDGTKHWVTGYASGVTSSSSTSYSAKVTITSTLTNWGVLFVNGGTANCTVTKIRIYK